ncbi:GMC family oxidoreductase [Nocardia sp. NPDC052316]|uniref:GMC family oxidoreductase n=1 Tax=Nocardia sp. NPDC052316 TaxID=3364329 RepID=UPI0037C7FC33
MSNFEPDVVIVGGGSAGAVLAARLSENPDRRVLLLEAGPLFPAEGYPESVASSSLLGADTGYDWGYSAEPGFIGHPVQTPRGKILGGSSGVNGAVIARALPADFARWTARGLKGWSFAEVLPSFRKLENTTAGSDEWHGRNGPLPVRQLTRDDLSTVQRAFYDAALAAGVPATDDFNGPNPVGVAAEAMNVVDGVRINTGMAYLTDAVRARPNLLIRGDELVDRVLFDRNVNRAIGVLLADGERLHAGQVILSAGTYGSAALLLRSGVGPAEHLGALGIPVVANLPVGSTLYDHPFYYNAYAAHPERMGDGHPVIGVELWTASTEAAEGELDLHVAATHLIDQSLSPTGAAFVLPVALTRPRSVGSLRLASRDPNVAPRIDLNFLADAADRRRLLEGIALSRRIARTAPLSKLIDHELTPGDDVDTDAGIEASVLTTLDTYHHPTSTAPMGAEDDPAAVVDRVGAVRGVEGLRVVDASIFPDAVCVAINATVIMAAEHIAAEL